MITVGLYKSNTVVSKLIRWQTRGTYSHAALHFDNDETAIEAWHKGGVQMGPVGHLHDKGTVIDVYEIKRFFFEDTVRRYAEMQVGKPYDFTMVARFMSRRGESRKSKKKLFCSELVFDAIEYGGLQLFKKTEGWEVSPDLLKRSPYLQFSHSIQTGDQK